MQMGIARFSPADVTRPPALTMKPLFPIFVEHKDIPAIPGLDYRSEYISSEEEVALVAAIDSEPWDTTWERRRQLYGGAYGGSPAEIRPVPPWGLQLANRIFEGGFTARPFDHMLVNEYCPGQGIALHRDYEPFDRTVASISLLSPCVMQFREIESGATESLLLEPHSLLILSDAARYDWQHGIARRKNDLWQGIRIPRERRLSITFRTSRMLAA
jgi:alkylated DNA repair dioxygenase AlkB